MYHYFAHGLHITSDLACPELALMPCNNTLPNVTIRLGATPPRLANPTKQSVLYQAKPSEFLLCLEQVARFWVRDGNEITIQPAADAPQETIRLFLFGSAFGALLHQRGQLILHGSAIETAYGAIVFVGPSGVGKSTLAAALHQRGYRVLSDDVCSVICDPQSGEPLVQPGLTHLKLWADSAEQLALPTTTARRVRPELDKYALPLNGSFASDPVRLRAVYILHASNLGEWQIEPLAPMQKIEALVSNTYRQRFLIGLEMRPRHLQLLARIAPQIRICRMTRPSTGFLIEELVQRLEADWGKTVRQ